MGPLGPREGGGVGHFPENFDRLPRMARGRNEKN